MAFEPEVPSAADYLRDPIGSFQRLLQVLNYRLDQWNALEQQIPVMYARITTFDNTLKALPNTAGRQAVADQLVKHRQAVDAMVAQKNSLAGKVLDAMNAVRGEGSRINQAASVVSVPGLGIAQVIIAPLVIAVVGVAIYGITQIVNSWIALKAQNESVASRVLAYAQTANLTPSQIAQVSDSLAKNKPAGPGGLFDDLGALLPAAAGIIALILFGPALARMMNRGK